MQYIRKVITCIIYLQLLMLKCNSYEYPGMNTPLRVSRQTRNGCILPQHPNFGKWTVYKTSATTILEPGNEAPLDTILQVGCNNAYKLIGDATMVCIAGNWTSPIGECLLTCPSRYSSQIMTVTCSYEGRDLKNCEEPVDGTKARFQCADYYEDKSLELIPTHVCYNGKWNYNLPDCVPICGQKKVKKDPTLIIGGNNASQLEYPWQVALYNNTDKTLLCGGSLITQRVVLTAAHCVTDVKGQMYPKDIYVVAVGKYYRKFDDEKDTNAQYSSIYKMFTPRQYKGDIQNYFGDIALIVSTKIFTLSPRVQPVCIDWGLWKYKAILNPAHSTYGLVTGWGNTVQHKNPSEVLKELEVPLITDDNCKNNLPDDYERFLTDDKICAGFTNAGTSVCLGDSGGGLVVKYKKQYYVLAVVSLSPLAQTQEGGCDSQKYALYTRVPYHIDFILDTTVRYKAPDFDQCEQDCETTTATTSTTTTTVKPTTESLETKCVLPEHPKNGKWSIFGFSEIVLPGIKVVDGTILQISCQDNYKLNGVEINICNNGQWINDIGTCLKECLPLHNTETTLVTCSYHGKKLENCTKPFDGVIAKYSCAPFYENSQLSTKPVIICVDGTWDKNPPECTPTCGHNTVTTQVPKKAGYPWQVGLYRGESKQYYGGGSLISTNLILSAAHCVTSHEGNLYPIEEFVVVAGKYHINSFNKTDQGVQISELQNIFIPPEYTGSTGSLFGDIAILITKKPFKLTPFVYPVCIDRTFTLINDNFPENVTGYISSWGFTLSASISSLILQNLDVTIISYEKCIKDVPPKFQVLLTPDKICAGSNNKFICRGDSGGGLFTEYKGRFYLTGIISTAIEPKDGCGTNALYTKLSYYSDFILDKEAQAKSSTTNLGCENTVNCPETTTIKPAVSPEPSSSTCILPPYPLHGQWSGYLNQSVLSPGDIAPIGTVLFINCYNSYKLLGDSTILCSNGKWSSNIGTCEKLCPPIYSTSTRKAICIQNNKNFENCTEPINGTLVKFECEPYYENVTPNPVRICLNGIWDSEPPQCIPVCGQKSVSALPLIINGRNANKMDYPWHVAIYRDPQKEFICNGALIAENIVLTSAVCVASQNIEEVSKDLYRVVAGKYYREYNDLRENTNFIQERKLKEILIHPDFQIQLAIYFKNIAVLITEKPFKFSIAIQPVCVDWRKKFITTNSLTGYVTGWGFISNRKLADELQELKVPIINNRKCARELSSNLVYFLTHDRFCAGYTNQSKGICKGDSGGPLVVKIEENNRYYLSGIADIVPTIKQSLCGEQQYAIFSNISYFIDYLLPIVQRFTP